MSKEQDGTDDDAILPHACTIVVKTIELRIPVISYNPKYADILRSNMLK